MKFITLDNKEVNIQLLPSNNTIGKVFRSRLQTIVGEKLQEIYNYESILEDWNVPRSRLSLDFYIPRRKLAIEVSPKESGHNYSAFFHGQKQSGKFFKQKKNDVDKARFCEINDIKLIEITSEEDIKLLSL